MTVKVPFKMAPYSVLEREEWELNWPKRARGAGQSDSDDMSQSTSQVNFSKV